MKVVAKRLDELHEAKKNIRKHTDKQLVEYVRSLEMFGQIKPIVVDEHGEIIAGNGLYKALLQMGKETCDCYVLSGLTDKQKKKLMLADNKVYELGITDISAFEEIVLELEGDIDIPGWDSELLTMLNSDALSLDDMVSGYGAFEEEDVSKLDGRTSDVGSTDPMGVAPSEQPPSETRDGASADEQRVIICPKCGERICL